MLQLKAVEGDLRMKYSELKTLLKKNGCYKLSEGAKHENWFSPITSKIFQVGRHNTEDVKKGILSRMLKDAGLK
jgi:predicted RNA binding protein YcfA (HicA-like mRNA interferase family)